MTYAETRRIIDVDSHVIELDDFLYNAADPRERALLPGMSEQTELPVVEAGLDRGRELFAKRQRDPEVMAKFEASLLDARKSGWNRLGAFNPSERARCLDLFGFDLQLLLIGHRGNQRAIRGGCGGDQEVLELDHVAVDVDDATVSGVGHRGLLSRELVPRG